MSPTLLRRSRWEAAVPVLAFLMAAACALWQIPALAQSTEPENADYRNSVAEAVAEFEAKNYAESLALFTRAHHIFPNARTLRGIGIAEFELRMYTACVQHLQGALDSDVKPISGKLRDDAKRLLDRALTFVGRVRITAEPAGALILVDDAAFQPDPDGTALFDIGEHQVEASMPGRQSVTRTLTLIGGETKELALVLPEPPPPVAPTAPTLALAATPAPVKSERRAYKNPWLWTAVGVVIAGAAVGAYYAFSAEPKVRMEPFYGGDTNAVLTGP
ncbi:MAG: hypothetical protein QM778_34605 [Myxococcales bacterium]